LNLEKFNVYTIIGGRNDNFCHTGLDKKLRWNYIYIVKENRRPRKPARVKGIA